MTTFTEHQFQNWEDGRGDEIVRAQWEADHAEEQEREFVRMYPDAGAIAEANEHVAAPARAALNGWLGAVTRGKKAA